MLVSTEGIVLKKTRYGDTVSIVTIYTRASGIMVFSFKGKPGRTFNGAALLAPMTLVRLVTDVRHGKSIQYTRELSLLKPYKHIHHDTVKGGVLLFLNELLLKVLKEEESNESLFDFLLRTLTILDEQIPLHPSYHLSFMIHLTFFLGFFPHNGNRLENSCFDLREGSFVHPPFLHQEILNSSVSHWLNELINIPFDQYQLFLAGKAIRNQLLDALICFYQLHVAGFGDMKSLPVLRSLSD